MGGYWSIGELAKETDVKVVTIRYYEQIGVLSAPRRTAGNYRAYGREHLQRLRFIRRCRGLGFSLQQIRDLFRLSAESSPSCAEVCRMAERHLKAVEDKLADLNALRRNCVASARPAMVAGLWPSAALSKLFPEIDSTGPAGTDFNCSADHLTGLFELLAGLHPDEAAESGAFRGGSECLVTLSAP